MTIKKAFILLQYILPHHFLSGLVSKLTHAENKTWKNFIINKIIQFYAINMAESAEQDLDKFSNFNVFFTRKINPKLRPIVIAKNAVACPADGVISQVGLIEQERIFQAKDKYFSTVELLGGDADVDKVFAHGSFATIYLSPKDCHRVYMPIKGTLTKMHHIPGRLFSVNAKTTNLIPGLFARNERVICLFTTKIGTMAVVFVGAIFVSSIETTWHGVVTPPTIKSIRSWKYKKNPLIIAKGEEIGRFNMGSTIIVLFEKNKIDWKADFKAGKNVKFG